MSETKDCNKRIKLKIAICCDVLGEENNGTTVAALNLIRFLKGRGHDVRVLCPNESKRGEAGYYIVPTLKLIEPLRKYVEKVGVEIATPDREVIMATIADADIVHIMTPFILGTVTLRLAKQLGKPITAGFHCQAENLTSHLKMMNLKVANDMTYKVMQSIFYRFVDCIHFPTQFIRDIFENEVGPTKGVVISNGVSDMFCRNGAERPAEYSGKFLILNVGRFAPEKAQHILIDAVRMSRHERDIQLIMAGGGPLEAKLKEQSRPLTNPPVFKLFPREELVNVANYADLYVHAAEVDLEAIACLEAISCGQVPVIADSPRCATKNFALGERNLFKYNDAASLAERIDWWIEHPAELAAARGQYTEYAGQFRLGSCMARMEQMMYEVAGEEMNA